KKKSPHRRFRPQLEHLEDRVVPANPAVSLQQFENLAGNWANGQANFNQARFLEGDTVPYWVQATNLTQGQTYAIRIDMNLYQKTTNAGGFAYLNTYNATFPNLPNNPKGSGNPSGDSDYNFSDTTPVSGEPGLTPATHPTFGVVNANILSVT